MLLLIGWSLMGLVGYAIGHTKGRALFGLCLGILLGPIGWLLLLCFSTEHAECAQCCKPVDQRARICPYCRSVIVTDDSVRLVRSEDPFEKWKREHGEADPAAAPVK